jgi:putative ABC transport system permease protein
MLLLKLAFLNVGRNPRRSFITVAAVGVGLAALIFLWGFSDGTTEQQRQNVIRLFTGHLQLHAAGFQDNFAPEKIISDRPAVLEKIKSHPLVEAFSERIKCEALIGTTENSRGILLIGMDPSKEPTVTDLKANITQGEFLTGGKDREVLLGEDLAKKLSVTLGNKVVILTQAADGTMAGYAYYVKGIFKTGSEQVDEFTAYISLSAGRELLSLEEESHEFVIRLRERAAIEPFLADLKGKLAADQYEFHTWDQIVPEVEQWVIWSEAVIRTILMTVMIVIGVGIMNTVLMSVFERTRELGVMMAVGTSPRQIGSLILLETFILEAIGIVLGLAGGYAAVFYFSKAGIKFHGVENAFAASFMSTTVYTQVQTFHVVQSIITLLVMTTFIGLYPAWKAGKMEPIKAIYHSY